MLKGLWKLSWIETKVFVREPMGVVGSLVVPVVIFVIFGRMFGASARVASPLETPLDPSGATASFNAAILAALLIAVGAVQSLIAIIAIYREGGILKRLRATPLSPASTAPKTNPFPAGPAAYGSFRPAGAIPWMPPARCRPCRPWA